MQRERLGGGAMIAGAVMGLVTMTFHPSDTARPWLVVAVHALAIASAPLLAYGGFVLARRLSGAWSELAFAFYALSGVATLLAAAASGLVAPGLAAYAHGGADGRGHALFTYNHLLNQAFARVLVAASSAAIGLWSVEILRTRRMGRAAGVLGCAIAAVVLPLLFFGHLRLDVHGFGAVVLGQTVWLVMVGLELRRAQPAA